MEDVRRWQGADQRVWLNRGDRGLGHDAVMRWHEQQRHRPYYLFKLGLISEVRIAVHQVPGSQWQGPANAGARQAAKGSVQLHDWKQPRRVVFARCLQGQVPAGDRGEFWDRNKHGLAVYVTNLLDPWQIQQLYRECADTENVFDELEKRSSFNGLLFVRFIEPRKHTEAKRVRRW